MVILYEHVICSHILTNINFEAAQQNYKIKKEKSAELQLF